MTWQRRNRDNELDEEIRSHIRMAIEDRVRQGEDRELARAAVMKEFGNVALTMEDTRRVWGGQWLEQLAFDLRYAARSLGRAPGFALAAVLSVAIGIGATTALFSVLQHVAWQPLPYRNPGTTGHRLEPGSANRKPPIAGFLSGLAGLAHAGQGIRRPGGVPQSSRISHKRAMKRRRWNCTKCRPISCRCWGSRPRWGASGAKTKPARPSGGNQRSPVAAVVRRRARHRGTPHRGQPDALRDRRRDARGIPHALHGYADQHPPLTRGFHVGAVRSQARADGESRQPRTAHPGAA